MQSRACDKLEHSWPTAMNAWMENRYLKRLCPPIKLVGVGSSRTAYACLGGKCLKVARSERGVAQNAHEEKLTKRRWWSRGWDCFAQTYAASNDHALLLTECCAKIESERQLAEAFGMGDFEVFLAVVKAAGDGRKHDLPSAARYLKDTAADLRRKGRDFSSMLAYAAAAEKGAAWLDRTAKTGRRLLSPGQKSFMELAEFWSKNGADQLLPGDVTKENNWGLAVRDGQIAPVLLDIGFSRDVARRFYR